MLYFLSPFLAYFVYLWFARIRLRRLAYAKREPADTLAQLRWWALHPLSPVKLEARLMWSEATRMVDRAAAWEILHGALETKGRKAVLARLLAGRWSLQEQWPEHAERHWSAALALLTRSKDKLLRARIHRMRAEAALRAGEPAAALARCDDSLADNPYDSEVRLLRAGIRFHEGDPAGAVGDYDFLETHFGNPALRVRAGINASYCEIAAGRVAQAAGRLEKLARDTGGANEQLRHRLQCVSALAGRPAAAAHGAAEGYAAMTAGDWPLAQRKLAEGLFAVQPTDPAAGEMLWLLAAALRAAGQQAQALAMEDRIRAIWPRSPYLQRRWEEFQDNAACRVAS